MLLLILYNQEIALQSPDPTLRVDWGLGTRLVSHMTATFTTVAKQV